MRSVYGYSAYGETQALGVDGDIPNNANQYTARENDGLVGGTNGGALYYYRARYYDPVLKRFVSEDPIGLAGGWNSYGYVDGNAVLYRDPTGKLAWVAAAGIVGAIAGAYSGIATVYATNNSPSSLEVLTGALSGAVAGSAAGIQGGVVLTLTVAAGAAALGNSVSQLGRHLASGKGLDCFELDRSQFFGAAAIGLFAGTGGVAVQGAVKWLQGGLPGVTASAAATQGAVAGTATSAYVGFIGQVFTPASSGGIFP